MRIGAEGLMLNICWQYLELCLQKHTNNISCHNTRILTMARINRGSTILICVRVCTQQNTHPFLSSINKGWRWAKFRTKFKSNYQNYVLEQSVQIKGILRTFLQCWGSVTFWYGSGCGSGSSDPYLWLKDPDRGSGKPKKPYGSGCEELVNNHKEVTKQKKSRLSYYFCLMMDPEPDSEPRIRYLW